MTVGRQPARLGWGPPLVLIAASRAGLGGLRPDRRARPDHAARRPSRVLCALWDSRAAAVANLIPTLVEALVGCGLSVALAAATAIALDRWAPVRRAVEPLLVTSQTIPIVAIAPLFVIWFGFGLLPKVLIVVLVTFFPVTIALLDGFGRVDARRDAADALARRHAAADVLGVALAIGAAVALHRACGSACVYAVIGAIFGEYVGATDGLGIWMKLSQTSFRTDLVFARDPADRGHVGRPVPRGRYRRAGGRAMVDGRAARWRRCGTPRDHLTIRRACVRLRRCGVRRRPAPKRSPPCRPRSAGGARHATGSIR